MSAQIEKFCSDLRVNMTMIDEKLQALKAKAAGKADEAEHAARQQMDSLQKKIDESHATVAAAEAKAKEWVEAQKSAAQSKIAEWKSKGDEKSLQARADLADTYAKGMSVIASSAVNKAAKAALESLVAHYDVAASKVARAVR
jgi:hypothetical protein